MLIEKPLPELNNCKIAVIGLGYVGLPLSVEFSTNKIDPKSNMHISNNVLGFDINKKRLSQLKSNFDQTNEVSPLRLKQAVNLSFSDDTNDLVDRDVFIVTVPTPIDSANQPNLDPLRRASETIGHALKQRSLQSTSDFSAIVIYESTVYPGATEEVCIPILELYSDLEYNQDFFVGYSPERINPGDKDRPLTSIKKITSGSTPASADWINKFYGSIITAGTHQAPTLKVAEAAKVIENTQRDLNIALVNELSIIFHKMGIDTNDVLRAAGTKWNFLKFYPGLVGGHCIGVDPYYLTYKAEQLDYHPQIVLSGRRINNSMPAWISECLVVEMAKRKIRIGGAKVLILGYTFKENCPDVRNTKSLNLYHELIKYSMDPFVYDPYIDNCDLKGINIIKELSFNNGYDAVILAVAHSQFSLLDAQQWQQLVKEEGVLVDLKAIIPRTLNPFRL